MSGDVTRGIRSQEHDGSDDFFKFTDAAHRRTAGNPLVHTHHFECGANHFGDDEARRHRVHANSAVGPLTTELQGQVAQCALGCGVSNDVGFVCSATHDRTDIDNVAALALEHVPTNFAHVHECSVEVNRNNPIPRRHVKVLG